MTTRRRRVVEEEPAGDEAPLDFAELDFEMTPNPADDSAGLTGAAGRREPARDYGEKKVAEIEGIISGIVSISPRKLNERLERSEKLDSRELSVIFAALDAEDEHVREASNLAFIAKRSHGRLKVEVEGLKARLRSEAQDKAPRKLTAKGEHKALTVADIEDYYRTHPDLIAMRMKLADFEAFSEHCERLAKRRAFRPRTLELMLDVARATGTGKTSGYGDDN